MGAGSATDDEGPSDSGKCVALACGACSCAQGGAANRVGRTRRSLSSSIVPPHVTAPLRQAAAAPLPSSRTLPHRAQDTVKRARSHQDLASVVMIFNGVPRL
eukprot:CAMPEP_0114172404 /NCGR_PEP_ID=MMETSP0043_2-20121206/35266_1 /TAXON_ID=464988 /ORGANISM="Hemiselmis andersenii, Strain CCMP644" /LENGTH=101 /DNA_ID=CAMNT_0001270295 /DNA_START=249 /DNA_END=550 /DNA_ORIENTATION=+